MGLLWLVVEEMFGYGPLKDYQPVVARQWSKVTLDYNLDAFLQSAISRQDNCSAPDLPAESIVRFQPAVWDQC